MLEHLDEVVVLVGGRDESLGDRLVERRLDNRSVDDRPRFLELSQDPVDHRGGLIAAYGVGKPGEQSELAELEDHEHVVAAEGHCPRHLLPPPPVVTADHIDQQQVELPRIQGFAPPDLDLRDRPVERRVLRAGSEAFEDVPELTTRLRVDPVQQLTSEK